MKLYVNENVKNMTGIFPIQGRYSYYHYDMNENSEGLPKRFVNSVLKEITKKLEIQKKILVHTYGNELHKDYIRVSVGSKKTMKVFIESFLEIDGE